MDSLPLARRARLAAAFVVALVGAAPLVPFPARPAGAADYTIVASADTTALGHHPDQTDGSRDTIEVDGDPDKDAFLRFAVPELSGGERVTLRLFVTDPTGDGPDVHLAEGDWSEATLTWSNRPAPGRAVAGSGTLEEGTWATWDLTGAVTTGAVTTTGELSLVLVADSDNGADFASREGPGEHRPQLVVEAGVVGLPSGGGLVAVADASAFGAAPEEPAGSAATIEVDGSPEQEGFLRFVVPSAPTGGQRVVLRMYATDATSNGPEAYRAGSDWGEGALTWSSRPSRGSRVADIGRISDGSWAEWDVTDAVTGAGALSLALVADSNDGADFASREAEPDRRPRLVFEALPTTEPPTTTTTTGPDADCDPPRWRAAEVVGELPSGTGEMSGLVGSAYYPGWAWGVRDSGNPASLYAFRPLDGGTVPASEFPVPNTSNRDWEDVAYMGDGNGPGTLWVLENRGNSYTGNRVLYKVAEPDPAAGGPARLLGRYEFRYPDGQWNSETLLVFGGDLVLISKTSPARVYRFLLDPIAGLVNVPLLVGTLADVSNPSIASVSPGGRLLTVASHNSIRVYRNGGLVSDLLGLIADPPVHRESMPDDNREGGAFFPAESCDIVLVAESKRIWRLEHGS